MSMTTHFYNALSTQKTIPTMTAFKRSCSVSLRRKLAANPHFWQKNKSTCNKRFTVSSDKNKRIIYLNLKEIANATIYSRVHDRTFNCRTPCTTNVYTIKYAQTMPSTISNTTFLLLMFEKILEVGHSTFSINEQTFVTRLGGSVSSGRTLLWTLVSLLGASQVYLLTHLDPLDDLETQQQPWLFGMVTFHQDDQTKQSVNSTGH